jgi:hypothetical protein
MATNSGKIQHLSGPLAAALCAHIDGPASNADTICKMGLSGPVAIEIARQMKAGAGNAKLLFEFCRFSAPDAAFIAAAITSAGAK